MFESQPFSAVNASKFEAYSEREDLVYVVVPDGQRIDKIGESAFEGCINLQIAEIFADIEEIEFGAFENCRSLRTVIFHGTSLKHIHGYAFHGCTALKLVLPDSLSIIGKEAFKGVKCLKYKGCAPGAPWGAALFNPDPDSENQLNNQDAANSAAQTASFTDKPEVPAEGVKETISSFVSNAADFIKENTQKEKLRENAENVKNKVSGLVTGTADFIRENANKEKLRENAESVKDKVSGLVTGTADFIRENANKEKLRENAESVKGKVSGLVSNTADFIKENAQKEKLRENAEALKYKVSGFFSKFKKK
ncbi:leucine-rich repeat protein [bacterium]|nr:leucine-rich repeat protein [bacterium]